MILFAALLPEIITGLSVRIVGIAYNKNTNSIDFYMTLYYNCLTQVRVEDSLKEEAAQVFERLGIDTSTAVRIFLKRAIMENGIPFRMTLPKAPYSAERGYRAMVEIGEASEKNGLSDMPLDEINAEIEASRRKRQISGQ